MGAQARLRCYVIKAGLPLTINAVIHRANLHQVGAFIDLAVELGARRLEVAHTQYYGWALLNRAALMPPRKEVEESIALVEAARVRLKGELVIDMVIPDYYARYPKPCAGGWGRIAINVSPSGKALPCHAAESIPGLEFWNVRDHSLGDIWRSNPAFKAFRGTDWMREPCRSCDRREIDWGGCRCQALALTGDARNADPPATSRPITSASWRRRWRSPNRATGPYAGDRTRRRSRPEGQAIRSGVAPYHRPFGFSSWPGLTRPSTKTPNLAIKLLITLYKQEEICKWRWRCVDGRVKPGHDISTASAEVDARRRSSVETSG